MFRLHSMLFVLAALVATSGGANAEVFWSRAGQLNVADATDFQGKRFEAHTIFLEAGQQYVFEMNSSHFDTFLRLKSRWGSVIVQNDDGGPGRNSRIVFKAPTAGMYTVVATSFAPGATGGYQVRAYRGGFLFNVEGDLRFGDPLYNGRHKNVHTVFLEAGREHVIDLRSRHFDAFVKVTNGWGLVVAQNDDGGPGRNSRLVFRPKVSRTYNIVATSCAPGATGHYLLTVRD